MNIERLPSGLWRVKVLVRSDYIEQPDGSKKRRRVFKTFLSEGKTQKDRKKVVAEAAAFEAERRIEIERGLTFGEAVDRYISEREATKSVTTLSEYKRIRKKEMQTLMNTELEKVTQELIQKEVDEACKTHSSHTVRNWHGLVSGVAKEFRPDLRLNTNLPEKEQSDKYIPTEEEIKHLLDLIKGDPLEIPVLLAVFGPLRRGEAAALRAESIQGNRVHVYENLVMDRRAKEWQIKPPKSFAGDRYIEFPDSVAEKWKHIKSGRLTDLNSDQITNYFGRFLVKNGIIDENGKAKYSYHSLRHFCASYLHSLGIPNAYIMQRGGWDNEDVLNRIYRHVLDQAEKTNVDIANQGFNAAFFSTVTTDVTTK